MFGIKVSKKILWVFYIHFYISGDELIHSEYIIGTTGTYALSRVEFVVLSSDNNLPLTCKGQVDKFPPRFASFILNVTCK